MRFQLYPTSSLPVASGVMEALVELALAKGLTVVSQRRGSVVVEGDPKAVQQLSPLVPDWDIDPVQKSAGDSSFLGTLEYKRNLSTK
jgi:hypothetical protein